MNDGVVRKLLLTISSIWLSLLLVDFFLRFAIKRNITYLEKNGLRYKSPYRVQKKGWFHIMRPNIKFSHLKAEYLYSRKTNSLGLPDVEFKMAKDDNEFRIIALGDSFTEGVGTKYDSTWVKSLERILSEKYPDKLIITYNCGVSGSDVIFEYILLKEKLLIYRPDLVIVALNRSDIDDIITRGGMERFKNDGTLQFKNPPKWENLYATSSVVRLIINDLLHYNSLLIKEEEYKQNALYALNEIDKIIDKFKQLSIENNFSLLIVLHPFGYEVERGRYDPEELGDVLKDNKIESLDLLEVYFNKRQITRDNAYQFYWLIDAHHNEQGYQIMGQNIAERIIEGNYIE
jgi:lysophospholipase L1-like esterase